jgi:hypothetical protein
MSLIKTWYETEAAASKYGVEKSRVLEWVEEGLVRCEREGETVVRVNIDDVRLQVEDLVREA